MEINASGLQASAGFAAPFRVPSGGAVETASAEAPPPEQTPPAPVANQPVESVSDGRGQRVDIVV